MRYSPFTVECPPPPCPPQGVPVVIGWELASSLWRSHLPDPLSRDATCTQCHLPMPCFCWLFADAFLAEAVAPADAPTLDDATRELPRIEKPRLPRRQPGASLAEEERYEEWFTQ